MDGRLINNKLSANLKYGVLFLFMDIVVPETPFFSFLEAARLVHFF